MQWDDTTRTLTIGARKGQFAGMWAARTFQIVLVGPGHGIGEGITSAAGEVHEYILLLNQSRSIQSKTYKSICEFTVRFTIQLLPSLQSNRTSLSFADGLMDHKHGD